MNRRIFLSVCLSGACFCGLFTQIANSAETLTAKTLKATLRVRTKAENDYIDAIVALREKKKLPEPYIYSAYRYAMQRPNNRFVYFVAALKEFCKKGDKNGEIALPEPPKGIY